MQGILLYGPPGTGKTHVAKVLAAKVEMPFLLVQTSTLVDKFLGNSARNVKMLFRLVSLSLHNRLSFIAVGLKNSGVLSIYRGLY